MTIVDRQQKEFAGDKEHLDILLNAIEKHSVQVWNEWRRNNNVLPNLQHANLIGAKLTGVDFNGADLRSANLTRAELSTSELSGIDLGHATLIETRFCHASIYSGFLREANLKNANLEGAVLNYADLSHATLTGAKIYGMSKTDWEISGIICDFVYTNKRIPEGRNFESGEFERLYKQYPTFELDFKNGLNTLTILIAGYAAVQLNAEKPGYNFQVKEVSSYGMYPVIKVTVNTMEQIEEGKAILTERILQYEKRIADKDMTISKLFELAMKNGPHNQINFNAPAQIEKSVIGQNFSEQNNQVYNISLNQIDQIEKQIEKSTLDEKDKSVGKEILSELKKTASEEVMNKLKEWAKNLTSKGLEQIPSLLALMIRFFA